MKKLILLFTVLAFVFTNEVQSQDFIDYDKITIVDDIAYFKYDMTLVTGTVKMWGQDGQLMEESNFKDGERDGVQKAWYKNGQLMGAGNFKDGKPVGVGKAWHKNGQLMFEGNFKDGERDGVQKVWHDNGQIRSEETYKDGKLISTKYWDEDGRKE